VTRKRIALDNSSAASSLTKVKTSTKVSRSDVPENRLQKVSNKSNSKPNSKPKRNSQRGPITNQHLRTRRDHASETAEDYVEAIAAIQAVHIHCRLKDLSGHFGVSHVTASKILARLSREGLVETKPYSPVSLTVRGVEMATLARLRHQLVVEFLVALGVAPVTAQIDAEGIEHHVSSETMRCIKKFLAAKARSV
jgi:DtxR family manganese transport transcriptional regulator